MHMLIFLINLILSTVITVVLLRVILGWLVNFEVIPAYHPVVSQILNLLYRLTEPILEKVRRFVPLIAGLDLSPWIVMIGAEALRQLIIYDVLYPMLQS